MDTKRKPPNPRPWMDAEPEPLPAEDAALLEEVYGFAEMLASAESDADAVAMRKAESLERLYQSGAWAQEWNRVRPPKADAVGRPVDPLSRNRFAQWQAWRAEKEQRGSLRSSRIYQLLNARTVAGYFHSRGNNSEFAIRPLTWMVTHGMADRIPEVEAIARDLADGGPLTNAIVRKALTQWKSSLTPKDRGRAIANAKGRPIRKTCENDFNRLMETNPVEAREFVKWAADQIRAAAKANLQVVS